MIPTLHGVRVLDASNVIAGPFCASLLGDFGAEVIKVEMPGVGDSARNLGPLADGKSLRWTNLGRNKKCVTLDLHSEKGKELFLKLVEKSDVLVENFRTGTLDKWGLDIETLRKANPKIIVARVTGFGQTGPMKYNSGFGSACTAFSGVTYINGLPETPPVIIGFSLADYVSGLYAMIGVLLCLYGRDVNGTPSQEIDVSLYESLFRLLDTMIANYYITGTVQERAGDNVDGSIPSGVYKTKDDQWVVLVCATDKSFEYFTKAAERPDLMKDYATMWQRQQNITFLNKLAGDWVASLDCDDVIAACEREKLPCNKIYSIKDIFNDPHYAFRKDIVEIDDPNFGKIATPAVTPRLSETPGEIKWTGPLLGSSNEAVYKELLGLSGEEYQKLIDEKVI